MTVRSLVQRVALGLAVVVSLGVVVLLFVASPKAGAAEKSWAEFDNEGHLRRPDGWREWVYVGTPLTPNELNPPAANFPEFHNVYIDPDSYAHYKKTGTFRPGKAPFSLRSSSVLGRSRPQVARGILRASSSGLRRP